MNVIVIGASSHLGGTVVRELGRRGARVGGTFLRGEERVAALGKELPGFVARRLDLLDAAAVEPAVGELAEALGGADAIVHCATVVSAAANGDKYDALEDVDPAALARMFAINVTSGLLCARAFSKAKGSREGARNLVLVGSIDGAKAVPTVVSYATSKGAVVAMGRSLAKELAQRGVLVNVVAPGVLESGITSIVPDAIKKEYLKHSAQKRFGTHAEVARTIAWLALENTYVTGQTMVLDGGL